MDDSIILKPKRGRKPKDPNAIVAMKPKPTVKESPAGYIWTSRTKYGTEEETTEQIKVPLFPTTPAKVRVAGHITKNLGNYNSARIGIEIELPCLPEESEVARTYQVISTMLDELIIVELQKLEE